MNAESSRLRSTGTTSSDMRAIWAGALLVVYLSATGLLLLIGHSRAPSVGIVLHFAVLVAIAAATWLRIVPRWLRDWAPLIALLFLYSEIPMLISAAGHTRLFDPTVMSWEQAIFRGQPALTWAAQLRSRALSEVLHASYLSYYGIIFSVPAGLFLAGRRAEFREAVFVLMLTYVCCFAWYVVFPVAGPRYLFLSPADRLSGPIRSTVLWLLESRSSRGTAFPSSHVAIATTQSILALRYFRFTRGGIILALSVGLAIGAIYGGFHYAVDVVAGAALGAVLTFAGLAISRALPGEERQANASAPT